MFILPPPPRSSVYYPPGAGYRDGAMLEATNTLTQFDSSSIQVFTAPEGVWSPKECLYLATPLPHPSDPPPAVVNPLAPTHTLPSTHSNGLRLSVTDLGSANSHLLTNGGGGSQKRRQMSTASNKSFGGWSNVFKKGDEDANGEELTLSTSAPLPSGFGRKDSLANGANGSGGAGGDARRKKPKSSLTKNNSSFISRSVIHDGMHKRLAERVATEFTFFTNVGRSLSWMDLAPASKQMRQEPLIKILFTKSHPLCHDINFVTKGISNLDVIIGMSSGDVIWIDCYSSKYNRLNKNGDVTRSAVTDIRWVPGSENLFVTAHADGSICIFDKDRDDGGFHAQGLNKHQDPKSTDVFRIIKSLSSPPLMGIQGKNTSPANPLAVYKVSNAPITNIKFSPDSNILAITNKDGYLRLLNLGSEQLADIFPSYYGGFLCCSWSPDGKYLATGGEDDMVCIWSMSEDSGPPKLFVRLQGHTSWVRGVEWDPWASDETNYRLASVGDDGKVLFWDFSPKTLNRPKAQQHKRMHSVSSAVPPDAIVEHNATELESGKAVLHRFVSLGKTPVILPVVSKSVKMENREGEGLSDLRFLENRLIVSGKDGRIWIWDRPPVHGSTATN